MLEALWVQNLLVQVLCPRLVYNLHSCLSKFVAVAYFLWHVTDQFVAVAFPLNANKCKLGFSLTCHKLVCWRGISSERQQTQSFGLSLTCHRLVCWRGIFSERQETEAWLFSDMSHRLVCWRGISSERQQTHCQFATSINLFTVKCRRTSKSCELFLVKILLDTSYLQHKHATCACISKCLPSQQRRGRSCAFACILFCMYPSSLFTSWRRITKYPF
jgi:hypothetical protein